MTAPALGSTALPAAELRRGYACFPSGVAVLAGLGEHGPHGMAVSTFVPVSLSPALVSVCVQHTSTTWPVLQALPRIGVSVLAEHQADLSTRFASAAEDRFAGVDWHLGDAGSVLIAEAAAWFSCAVTDQVRAGDHDIVVLAVHELTARHDAPLVFHASGYRRLQ